MDVKRDATHDEIKRAYRKLARKYHPDVSTEADAEARFKEVGETYEVFKDPKKRVAFDQLGANWKAGQDFRPPLDWDQGFEFHGGGYARKARREFHARGEDTYAKVRIDLEDACQGSTRTLTLRHTELSPDGRPQLREHSLNVRIPKGMRQGQLSGWPNRVAPPSARPVTSTWRSSSSTIPATSSRARVSTWIFRSPRGRRHSGQPSGRRRQLGRST